MGKAKESLDSLIGRVATGIHMAATATLLAKDATREELDLASLILRRNPEQSAPRENASSVETFNRLLDVAIDSANSSTHCGTRAERRARLAADLGQAAVILFDCSKLAELIYAKLELDRIMLEQTTEEPGPIPLLDALHAIEEAEEAEELELLEAAEERREREPRDFAPASVTTSEPIA